jgi:hypothetical protein
LSREQLDKLLVILERQKAEDDRASIDEARALMNDRCAKLLLPADVRREPVSAGGVAGEVFLAPGADPERTILYLHGGGYVLGSTITHAYLMQNVSRAAGAAVTGIDYRLAPEHPFPAAVDDALAAYRWLLDRGRRPSRIGVAGDSAGGGLTSALLVAIRDAGLPLPRASRRGRIWPRAASRSEAAPPATRWSGRRGSLGWRRPTSPARTRGPARFPALRRSRRPSAAARPRRRARDPLRRRDSTGREGISGGREGHARRRARSLPRLAGVRAASRRGPASRRRSRHLLPAVDGMIRLSGGIAARARSGPSGPEASIR